MTAHASTAHSFELHAGALRLALRADLGGCIAGFWHRDTPIMRGAEPVALTHERDAGSYALVPYSNRIGYKRFRRRCVVGLADRLAGQRLAERLVDVVGRAS